MAQSITTQSGTATVTSNTIGNFRFGQDPTLLTTAPSTGCSRVIINKLTLRNTGTLASTPFNFQFIIGQDSTGYSPIGGLYANTTIGMFSLQQTSGDSNTGKGIINGGSGGGAGGTAFFVSNSSLSGGTVKNISPNDVFIASPTDGRICTIPTQFWLTPSDRINVKLSTGNGVSYEVTYSFIFITEI
jgi:hypothetical protein